MTDLVVIGFRTNLNRAVSTCEGTYSVDPSSCLCNAHERWIFEVTP